MNERIKELSEQAEKYADDWFRGEPTWSEAFESKFAELVIQECIDIISPYTVRMSRPGEEFLHPISEIKKHFGL
jgi:hypothetical protein